MTITSTKLTRVAGMSAVVAGLLFIGVQINHPNVDAAFATTTEYTIRESVKIGFALLSLIGITGMYLRQVKQSGVLGLIGYVLFGLGYLGILCVQVIGVFVLPTLAHLVPKYVNDVLADAMGGTATGDIGLVHSLNLVGGLIFLAGGLVFGIALFRANILSRWASALLSVGAVATIARAVLPQVNPRLFAVPIAVAMIGLGISLWRDQRSAAGRLVQTSVGSQPDPAVVK